jgi:hypothetical protein
MLGGRFGLFARLWGVALVAHVVANPAHGGGVDALVVTKALVGVAGLWLSIRPSRAVLLIASALVLPSLLEEIPLTGSHWMLAALVSTAVLATGARPEATEPAVRWVLIVFYCFAAFSKLNSGFVDPQVSCATFYADQSLHELGVGPLHGALAHLVAYGSLLTELSIPILLAIRRTRFWGVVLALCFHGVISFDHGQHFYDFTSVLLPLFVLFLPDRPVTAVEGLFSVGSPRTRRILVAAWVSLAAVCLIMALRPLSAFTLDWQRHVPFVVWIPFYLALVVTVVRSRAPGDRVALALSPIAIAVVATAALNGAAPYFEVKTAFSFNMYSNLQIADGDSNHFIVRRGFPLRDGYRDPIEIVATTDLGLQLYQQRGWLIAYPQFRRYLADHPATVVTFRQAGQVRTVTPQTPLGDAGPWWWRYVPLRALDTHDPPRCQDSFLPAL